MRKPPAIVDLHTDTFLDDWEDYSPEELLQESIDFMRSNLDAAIYWEMNEIKFIHGKSTKLMAPLSAITPPTKMKIL